MGVGNSSYEIVLSLQLGFCQGFAPGFSLCPGIFGQRFAQQIQTFSRARTDANARDITILVALDSRLGLGQVDLVPETS